MKLRRYRTFIREFNVSGAKRRIPRRATFELTYKCNFKCVHCFTNLACDKSEISTKEAFSILDQMRDIGVFHIAFTGGEIFSRPDILDILSYTRMLGFEVSLLTNGSLITEEIADWLIKYRIRDLEISFHGASPETFEKVTKTPGSFQRVLDTIKIFKKKGVIVTMKACVLDLNLDELANIMAFAKSLGVSFRYSKFVVPRLDCDKTPANYRISPQEFIDIGKRFRGIVKPIKKHKRSSLIPFPAKVDKPVEEKDEKAFGCMAGRGMIFINPYGQIKPCIVLPVPNYDILNGTVKDGWQSIVKFTETTKRPVEWKCDTCEFSGFCSVCPARAYLNTGDMFGCPDYFKEVARLKKEKYEKKLKKEKEAVSV